MQTLSWFLRNECGGAGLRMVALGASVFGASLFGLGRFVEAARAQTALQSTISLTLQLPELRLSSAAQVEVQSALQSMSDRDLATTYARIFATFRDYVGMDDLSVARALVDYAALTEAELARRQIDRPAGTQSAAQMLQTWELVL